MAGDFKRISCISSMSLPINKLGHVDTHSLPCTVYGLYNEQTGTVILETVWCDNRNFDMMQLTEDELDKFYTLLRETAANLFF